MEFNISNIYRVSEKEFLEKYWDLEPLTSNTKELNELLCNKLRISDIAGIADKLIHSYQGPIMTIGAPVLELTDGIYDRVLLDKQKAKELFKNGCSLELDGLNESFPILNQYLEQLKISLGFPKGTYSKAIAYISNTNSGFTMHFDGYTNFIFQITGNKKWTLAKNESVLHPTTHLDLSDIDFMSEDLKSIWKGSKSELNLKTHTIFLKADNSLFLPRGIWHQTTAEEPSVSINFTFNVPTKADIISSSIRRNLLLNEELREAYHPDKEIDITKLVSEIRLSQQDLRKQSENNLDIGQSIQSAVRQKLWQYL